MRIERRSSQAGLFDHLDRERALEKIRRPLDRMNEVVDWEMFRPVLEEQLEYGKSPGPGRPAKDPLLMLKMCVLQDLHGLSDEETEFQVLDRTSFRRFLGLSVSDKVPDARTLWLFKERLGAEGVRALFERFHQALSEQGLIGKVGQIIDATVVQAPVQRNSREENAQIKQGQRPDSFDARPSRGRQKDTDARWTKKHGRYCYGYKNHAKADLTSKLVTDYQATPASVHDSQVLPDLVSPGDNAVLADAAYSGKPAAGVLAARGIRSFIHQKAAPGQPLSEDEKTLNRKKSRLRARVEHVFGWQSQRRMDQLRTIGLRRARRCIGMFNLTYNLFRTEQILRPSATA
mgnify:CR=1 FL=1